jgi:hypothetical protein
MPPFGGELLTKKADGTLELDYSEEQLKAFREDPRNMIEHRIDLEKDVSARCKKLKYFITFWQVDLECLAFPVHSYIKNHPLQEQFRSHVAQEMRERLAKKPELQDKLIPNWVRLYTRILYRNGSHVYVIARWLQTTYPWNRIFG